MNTDPFYAHSIRFRASKPNECSESECTLIVKDFIRKGYDKIMVVTNVALAYNLHDFSQVRSRWETLIGPHDGLKPFYASKLRLKCSSYNADCMEIPNEEIKWRQLPNRTICYPLQGDGQYAANWKDPQWIDSA